MSERAAQRLLQALADQDEVEPFELDGPVPDASQLEEAKQGADLLLRARLARYVDEGRTRMAATNPGRYWALHGGYLGFLKEDPERGGGGGRMRNPEFEELRMNFMSLRMKTFWWSFGMSAAGFVLSLISLYVALKYGERLLPPR